MRKFSVILTATVAVLAFSPFTGAAELAPCDALDGVGVKARVLLQETLAFLPDDLEKIAVDSGFDLLASPLIRDQMLGALSDDPENASIRQYLEASLLALPTLQSLADAAAILANECKAGSPAS